MSSINKFQIQNGKPSAIGVYCCPWAGWLTTNFNKDKTLEETVTNCPDFEFVAYDFLELTGWQNQYDGSSITYQFNGEDFVYNEDQSDEKLNEKVFNFLTPIVLKIKAKQTSEILLQMLDSEYVKRV